MDISKEKSDLQAIQTLFFNYKALLTSDNNYDLLVCSYGDLRVKMKIDFTL